MLDQSPHETGSADGSRAMPNLLRSLRAQARWLIACAIGLTIGYLLGAQYAWIDSSGQGGGLFPATFGTTLVAVGLVGGAGLLGLLLLIARSTRPGGQFLLLTAALVVVGFPIGQALGPRWQPPVAYRGEVVLDLAEPAGTRVTGTVTCWTEPNGDRIQGIEGGPIGMIGIDQLDVRLAMYSQPAATPETGSIELGVNDRAGYSGTANLSDFGARQSTGRATFTELRPNRFRIGGWVSSADGIGGPNILDLPEGLESLTGSLAWSCSSEELPQPGPDDVPVGRVQGWFTLSRLVRMPHPCSSDGPCLPYGYAIGTCTVDAPLRVESLETVVPWVDGKRARLRLVPERASATLTVAVDDGRAVETVRSAATVTERRSGAVTGSIGTRFLSAGFLLREGYLFLEVEWECGDNFER